MHYASSKVSMASPGSSRRSGGVLGSMPIELWHEVARRVDQYDRLSFSLSCKTFRKVMKWELKTSTIVTDLRVETLFASKPNYGIAWFRFVLRTFKRRESPVVKCKVREKVVYDSMLMFVAGYMGSKETLQYMQRKGIPLDLVSRKVRTAAASMEGASMGGHFEVIKWLRSEGCYWDEFSSSLVASSGNLKLLKWAKKDGMPWSDELVCEGASGGGKLEILRWSHARNEDCLGKKCCDFAARFGHLKVLRWLRRKGCEWDAEPCALAAEGGHLDVLRFLRREGCPWDPRTCEKAALVGDLELLKWLRKKQCKFDCKACSSAAQGGHLEVLKWLRSKRCPWDTSACHSAAANGHLEVLKWLRSQDPPCPWDYWVCLSACDGGYLDLLEFAVNEGGELIEDACVATAMSNGHRDVAEYLAGHIKENIEKRINRLKTESSISHVL